MYLICRFVLPYLSFLVSYSWFGNAEKNAVSLYEEYFVGPLGACGLVDKRCGGVDRSHYSNATEPSTRGVNEMV